MDSLAGKKHEDFLGHKDKVRRSLGFYIFFGFVLCVFSHGLNEFLSIIQLDWMAICLLVLS